MFWEEEKKRNLLYELTIKQLRQLAKQNKIKLVKESLLYGTYSVSRKDEIIEVLLESPKITKKKILGMIKAPPKPRRIPKEKVPKREVKPKIVPPLSQSQRESLIRKVGTRCCYPHCKETVALDVHHITPRSKGGTNRESNLVVLCPTHHTLSDRGAIPRARLKQYSVARMKKRK